MASLTDPVMGVDVGASTISAGLVWPATASCSRGPGVRRRGRGRHDHGLVDRILAMAERRGTRVGGIGIGLPGLVDVEKGATCPGAWLPELGGVPCGAPRGANRAARIRGQRRERAGPRGVDVRVGQGASSLVTMAIGTGIGAGLILDGALVRGHVGAAGEIGHLAVSLTGPRCVCGGVACLGTYVAGGFLPERVRERLADIPIPRCSPGPVETRAGSARTTCSRRPAAIRSPVRSWTRPARPSRWGSAPSSAC